MEIKDDYSVYDLMCVCWSGAEETLKRIIHYDMEDDFVLLFEETWGEQIPTLTEVNDWLRFDDEEILNYLGIGYEEEE